MSSAEELRNRLVESELLSAEDAETRYAQWCEETGDQESVKPECFIDWLVERDLITEFQGDAIVEGHVGPFMFGPYRVYEHVATGRLGDMYRAVHDEFNQPVSLKIFAGTANAEQSARIGREARIVAELDHPNVLRSFQIGRVAGTPFIALEEMKGETLAQTLRRETRLSYQRACAIIREVARGLQHLHENDVVHRDLRPENIWITDTGSVKLFEFGAARDGFVEIDKLDEGPELMAGDAGLSEYLYTAPEQANDARDASSLSDIYSLGGVLFHCLKGNPPFVEQDPVRLVLRHVFSDPGRIHEVLDDVPHQLDDTIVGMMAKDPAARFQTAEQVTYSLSQYAHEAPPEENVEVVGLSKEYLAWVESQQRPDSSQIDEDDVAMTPALTQFLGFMAKRRKRRT